MLPASLILADTGWLRFIPMIVVGAIWLFGIGSAIFKRASTGPKTPVVPIAPFSPKRPQPVPPPLPMTAKSLRPIPRPGALAKKRTDAVFAARQAEAIRQLVAGGRVPATPQRRHLAPEASSPAVKLSAAARSEDSPTTTATAPALVDGRSLSRRMQPALLRQQFILTEILRPPVSLRDDELD